MRATYRTHETTTIVVDALELRRLYDALEITLDTHVDTRHAIDIDAEIAQRPDEEAAIRQEAAELDAEIDALSDMATLLAPIVARAEGR